jgi:hypothetical protein
MQPLTIASIVFVCIFASARSACSCAPPCPIIM